MTTTDAERLSVAASILDAATAACAQLALAADGPEAKLRLVETACRLKDLVAKIQPERAWEATR